MNTDNNLIERNEGDELTLLRSVADHLQLDCVARAADRIEALEAEVKRLNYAGIHTCWDECPRLPCVQRREIEALSTELAVSKLHAEYLIKSGARLSTECKALREAEKILRRIVARYQGGLVIDNLLIEAAHAALNPSKDSNHAAV